MTRVTERRARLQLALLGALSLCLVTTANRLAARIPSAPPWLPDSCIASLLVCAAVYLAIRPSRPFAPPRRDTKWRLLLGTGAVWLAAWLLVSGLSALVVGHWIRYRLAQSPAQIAAFLFLGPLQEEMLFRGAIFELADRSRLRGAWGQPIFITTVFFALHHLQLHQYRLSPAALVQMGKAVPMGVVFGRLRKESDSLWPGFVVHILTNVPGVFGS